MRVPAAAGRRAAFLLALLALLPWRSVAEEGLPPEFLRARALVVRFLATAPVAVAPPEGSEAEAWTARSRRFTVSGTPVGLRLAREGLVVLVQVTPIEHGAAGVVVVAQGQIWATQPNGQIAYRSAFETLSVAFGERIFFYPLGLKADGSAAMRLEIAVDHYGDPPSLPEPDPADPAKPGQ